MSVVVATAIATAVSSSASAAMTSPRTSSLSQNVKVLKVALVAPSATNDLSWTQTMYSALASLKASQHLRLAVSANEYVTSDAANIIREYASQGYNLVIGHGGQYGSIIQQLAPKFPKVSFAWGAVSSTFDLPNVFAYEADANDGGYVQGYMAGMLSKSHVIGVIGPIATGDDMLYVDGFVAGVKAENKSNVIHPVYTGSYSDDSLMATAAKTDVSDGADVLSATTQSSVGALGIARSDKLPFFASDWSEASLAPHTVVSSQVYNWQSVLVQMFAAIRGGKLGGATYVIDIGNGGETIEFNRGYKLATPIKAEGEKLIREITDGALTPPQ